MLWNDATIGLNLLRERNETKIEWTRPFDNNYTKLPCGGVVCGGNQNLVGLQIVVTV